MPGIPGPPRAAWGPLGTAWLVEILSILLGPRKKKNMWTDSKKSRPADVEGSIFAKQDFEMRLFKNGCPMLEGI